LNETLDKAQLWELDVRWVLRQDRHVRWSESVGQGLLFDTDSLRAEPVTPTKRKVDTESLATDILNEWSGRSPTLKEIQRGLSNSSVYASDVNRALNWLKSIDAAEFGAKVKVHDQIKIIKGKPAL
jgi:hypothetical protein